MLAAAVWLVAVALRLRGIPSSRWHWRDDAVITLSHARGWIDFGVPSVSASGDRIEGYSSPLQLFLAGVAYRLGGSGWRLLLDVQVILGVAVAGFMAARLIRHAVRTSRGWVIVVAAGLVAVVALRPWVAAGWLVSGMENSLTIPLLLAVMAGMVGLVRVPSTRGWGLGVAFGLAGIVRTEFAILLVPALVAVLVMVPAGRRRVAWRVVAIGVATWLLAYGWRVLTFRTVAPNTAVVQDKTMLSAARLLPIFIITVALAVVLAAWRRDQLRLIAGVVIGTAAAVLALVAASWDHPVIGGIPSPHVAAAVALLVVAAAGWIMGAGDRVAWTVIVLVGMVPITQQLLLGGARLDVSRIGGQTLMLLATAAGVVLGTVLGRPRRPALTAAVGAGCGLAAVGLWLGWRAPTDDPTMLCCSIDRYTVTLAVAGQHAADTAMPRAIVAAPDLGKLSFPKSVVIVDLGLLGDPMATQIDRLRPDLVDDYLTAVQIPDVVAIHGSWTCSVYRQWVTSNEFTVRYDLVRADDSGSRSTSCPDGDDFRYYRRRPADPGYEREAALAGALVAAPRTAPAAVEAAAAECTAEAVIDPWSCQWVRRAIQRAIPELRSAGMRDDTINAYVEASPSGELDKLLLTTPPGWADDAARLAIAELDEPT